MKFSLAQKLEVIRTVQDSEQSARQTLSELGVKRSTYYGWYKRYLEGDYSVLSPTTQELGDDAEEVIHEAEARRLHVRLQMPVVAKIAGQEYAVHDISLGGFSFLLNNGEEHTRVVATQDTRAETSLLFSFSELHVAIKLEAQLVYVDEARGKAGFRYDSLTNGQLSNLRYFLASYVDGQIVSTDDLLDRISGNAANKSSSELVDSVESGSGDEAADIGGTSWGRGIRRGLAYAAIVSVGVAAIFGVANSYLDERYVIAAAAAKVEGELFKVRAQAGGVYTAERNGHTLQVRAGEALGKIGPSPTVGGSVVESPCDCLVVEKYAKDGEYVLEGSELLTLVDVESTPHVSAIVPAQALRRISIGDTGVVRLVSDEQVRKGSVTKIRLLDNAISGANGPSAREAVVILAINGELSPETVGTPAIVEFPKAPNLRGWISRNTEGPRQAAGEALNEYFALFK